MNTYCALCGHVMTLSRCGSATAGYETLCHADDHDCYQAWTVYGHRPVPQEELTDERLDELADNVSQYWSEQDAADTIALIRALRDTRYELGLCRENA